MSKKTRKSGGEKPSKSKKQELTDESEDETEEYDPHAAWDCTVCTFKNRFEAFKCEICDTRKGTSTRKPRLNSNVVQQQALVQSLAMDKAQKRHRLSNRGHSPDSQEAGPSGSNARRESSVSSNVIPDIGSPSSTSSKDKEMDTSMPKKERLRDSLIFRDSAKKYEVTDDSGTTITITAFRGRNSDKELRFVNALKEVSILRAKQKEKVEKARAEYEAEKQEFDEARVKSRAEKAAKPKKAKKMKKPPKLPKKAKSKAAKPASVFKVPATRGRPLGKATPTNNNKTPVGATTRSAKSTPGSSKKK